MSAATTYAHLRRLGTRVLTTGEASAALRTSQSAASRSLRGLETKGLARRVKFGLWIVGDEAVNPYALATELARPFPAYVSFVSALAARGAIDQIPRDITIASLGKPRRIETALGTYAVHRLPPELFGGFTEKDGVALATVEKAIFDYFYVASASGHPKRRLPELDLPADFSEGHLRGWIRRIRSPRLRTRVEAAIGRALGHADREERRPATRGRARAS